MFPHWMLWCFDLTYLVSGNERVDTAVCACCFPAGYTVAYGLFLVRKSYMFWNEACTEVYLRLLSAHPRTRRSSRHRHSFP